MKDLYKYIETVMHTM